MLNFIRILRDPNPGEAGAPPAAAPVVIPKTKEDWDKLAETDPKQWISLTQSRMDQTIRESRESREKLAAEQKRRENLEAELASVRKPPVTPVDDGQPKPFSRENLPKTQEEWDQLFIESPTLATDLRYFQNNQMNQVENLRTNEQKEFAKTQKECRVEVQTRHADMYVQETNSDGTPKVDGNGKPVLKVDPATGEPIFNADSEKGKLWIEVFQDDPAGFQSSKRGPRLMMLELERRLKEKAEAAVKAGQGQPGQGAGAQPDQRGTMPGGVPPPATGKVSFNNDEEKVHAQKAVERGIYKDLSEYCSLRDGKNTGFTEENRTPQFGK